MKIHQSSPLDCKWESRLVTSQLDGLCDRLSTNCVALLWMCMIGWLGKACQCTVSLSFESLPKLYFDTNVRNLRYGVWCNTGGENTASAVSTVGRVGACITRLWMMGAHTGWRGRRGKTRLKTCVRHDVFQCVGCRAGCLLSAFLLGTFLWTLHWFSFLQPL